MTTRQRTGRLRATGAGILAAAMAGGGLVAATTSAAAIPRTLAAGQCSVVELPLPEGGYDGGVSDSEVVDGETV